MLCGNIQLLELSHEELCYVAKHHFSIKKVAEGYYCLVKA